MKRKTIDVETVKTYVNTYLVLSEDEDTEARKAVAGVLEMVLHRTDNYNGFRYTDLVHSTGDDEDPEPGGIDWDRTDETRRHYI